MLENEVKKAEELIERFNFKLPGYEDDNSNNFLTKEEATRLAIDAVNLILENVEATKLYHGGDPKVIQVNEDYWLRVKKVLEGKLSIRENNK
jgi:hypothetical protein